jgi:hypothetical protein
MELLAVACTIRNHVVSRPGSDWLVYPNYMVACDEFMGNCPTRPAPELTEDALITPPDGLLCVINGVYDCTIRDVTSNHDHPTGAKYFARVAALKEDSSDWLRIAAAARPLIGTFGSMQFYG